MKQEEKPKKTKKKKKKALPKDLTDLNAKAAEEAAAEAEKNKDDAGKAGDLKGEKPSNTAANSIMQGFNARHIDDDGEEGEAEQTPMDAVENDSANEYNILDKKEQQSKMYSSMQKKTGEGKDFDGHLTYPNSIEQTSGGDLKVQSHQKPQRHLSALHSSAATSSSQLQHTAQCIAQGATCHLRHGLFPDRSIQDGSIRSVAITPCMQA